MSEATSQAPNQKSESKWVIIEIKEENGTHTVTAYPKVLKLEPGFSGDIIWYVYPPTWVLSQKNGVDLSEMKSYQATLKQQKSRPGCWIAQATNNAKKRETVRYFVNYQRADDPDGTHGRYKHDPQIENDPPSGTP